MRDNRINEVLVIIIDLLKKSNDINERLIDYWDDEDNCTVCKQNWWKHDSECIIGKIKTLDDIADSFKEK